MPTVRRHERTVFDECDVSLTGNLYIACKFDRCTLIFSEFPVDCVNCDFRDCAWRFDYVLHSQEQLALFEQDVWRYVKKSLPSEKFQPSKIALRKYRTG